MKKIVLISFLIQLSFLVHAQYQINPNGKGNDYYLNPIYAGDYPDPKTIGVNERGSSSCYKKKLEKHYQPLFNQSSILLLQS
jgi:hypothetical protein